MPTGKNYSESDVTRLWKEAQAKIGITDKRRVRLGAVFNGRRYVAAFNNEVWVTEQGRSAYTVQRGSANIADNYTGEVWIGKIAGNGYDQLLDVVRKDTHDGDSPTAVAGVASHAGQHLRPFDWRTARDAVDPVYIGSHQITDLLITPLSGFSFRVLPGYATVNGMLVQVPEGAVFTLDDTEVPAGAGDAKIARVELDDDGLIQLTYGSDYAEPELDVDALANAPAATAGRNTLGYLWMPNGMTGGEWKHIYPSPLHERTGGNLASDPDAIHENVAGEFAAITQKASPVLTDLLLIEDSEDSNAKKSVEIGDLPSSSGGNADIGCSLQRTAAQSTANGSFTAIVFDTGNATENWDTDGMHDMSTDPSRITIQTDGVYLVTGQLAWANNTNGQRIAALYLNGAEYTRDRFTPAANIAVAHEVTALMRLVATDYLELMAHQNATTLNVDSARFAAQLICET